MLKKIHGPSRFALRPTSMSTTSQSSSACIFIAPCSGTSHRSGVRPCPVPSLLEASTRRMSSAAATLSVAVNLKALLPCTTTTRCPKKENFAAAQTTKPTRTSSSTQDGSLAMSSEIKCTTKMRNRSPFFVLILQRGGCDSVGPYDQTLTSTSQALATPIFQAFHAK